MGKKKKEKKNGKEKQVDEEIEEEEECQIKSQWEEIHLVKGMQNMILQVQLPIQGQNPTMMVWTLLKRIKMGKKENLSKRSKKKKMKEKKRKRTRKKRKR